MSDAALKDKEPRNESFCFPVKLDHFEDKKKSCALQKRHTLEAVAPSLNQKRLDFSVSVSVDSDRKFRFFSVETQLELSSNDSEQRRHFKALLDSFSSLEC